MIYVNIVILIINVAVLMTIISKHKKLNEDKNDVRKLVDHMHDLNNTTELISFKLNRYNDNHQYVGYPPDRLFANIVDLEYEGNIVDLEYEGNLDTIYAQRLFSITAK